VAATNVIYDTAEQVVIQLPASDIKDRRFQTLKQAQWIDIQPKIKLDNHVATLVFGIQVPTLETAFILIR